MRTLALSAAATLVLGLCACGGGAGTSPEKVTNETTQAVYNDDLNAMQAHFDGPLQKQVTIDGVNTLSQKLHAFGAYKGLTKPPPMPPAAATTTTPRSTTLPWPCTCGSIKTDALQPTGSTYPKASPYKSKVEVRHDAFQR